MTTTQESSGLSLGELVGLLSEQTSRLVRAEIELAKAELTAKMKRLAVGIGLFVAAGVLLLYAIGVLIAAAVLGLSEALAPWLSALIVFAAMLLVIGILVLVGKRSVDKGTPPQPEKAIESVKADVEAVKGAVRS